jgi:hypothetical protein
MDLKYKFIDSNFLNKIVNLKNLLEKYNGVVIGGAAVSMLYCERIKEVYNERDKIFDLKDRTIKNNLEKFLRETADIDIIIDGIFREDMMLQIKNDFGISNIEKVGDEYKISDPVANSPHVSAYFIGDNKKDRLNNFYESVLKEKVEISLSNGKREIKSYSASPKNLILMKLLSIPHRVGGKEFNDFDDIDKIKSLYKIDLNEVSELAEEKGIFSDIKRGLEIYLSRKE